MELDDEERDAQGLNTDELLKLIEADEATDKAKLLSKLTPIEYARSRGMAPQRVYYAIRAGHVQKEECVCGRKVVDVRKCDEYFKAGEWYKKGEQSDTVQTSEEE